MVVKDLCFEIIEACPNKCVFCSSNSHIEKNQIISLADFKRVIDYFMHRGGIEELSISGGEPFLHPDLFEMVKYAKTWGIKVVIFTSGIKRTIPLPEEVIDYYIKERNGKIEEIETYEPWNERLKNGVKRYYERFISPPLFDSIKKEELYRLKVIGLDKIVFDYQAYEQETDQYLMGRSAQRHLDLLDSLINASIVGLETDVHFIPMRPNYKEILDILELLEIAKISQISILKFIPQGRGKRNVDKLMLSTNELIEFMNLLEQGRKFYSGYIRIGTPLLENNKHKCNAGLEKLDIKFDGTVLPCPAFKELDMETMKKYGIKFYSIYENLEELEVLGGTRATPLCKKIYYQ